MYESKVRKPSYLQDGVAVVWPIACVQHLVDEPTGEEIEFVDEITAESTDKQIPTAKAIWDLFQQLNQQ